MIYEALGSMLGQAGDAVQTRQESGLDDARSQRDIRQLALLLRRTRAIWPDLFSTLAAETEALERGLELANERLGAQDLERIVLPRETDPLARYRHVNRALEEAIVRLGTCAETANAALREIRAHLAEAAEIQGRLIDHMLSIR